MYCESSIPPVVYSAFHYFYEFSELSLRSQYFGDFTIAVRYWFYWRSDGFYSREKTGINTLLVFTRNSNQCEFFKYAKGTRYLETWHANFVLLLRATKSREAFVNERKNVTAGTSSGRHVLAKSLTLFLNIRKSAHTTTSPCGS